MASARGSGSMESTLPGKPERRSMFTGSQPAPAVLGAFAILRWPFSSATPALGLPGRRDLSPLGRPLPLMQRDSDHSIGLALDDDLHICAVCCRCWHCAETGLDDPDSAGLCSVDPRNPVFSLLSQDSRLTDRTCRSRAANCVPRPPGSLGSPGTRPLPVLPSTAMVAGHFWASHGETRLDASAGNVGRRIWETSDPNTFAQAMMGLSLMRGLCQCRIAVLVMPSVPTLAQFSLPSLLWANLMACPSRQGVAAVNGRWLLSSSCILNESYCAGSPIRRAQSLSWETRAIDEVPSLYSVTLSKKPNNS